MALLVLVVDRDDDIGRKAGIETPIIGRNNVLKAAEALLLADPEDSDGNTMFAAVKIYDELVSSGKDAEIAVVAGDARVGLFADMRIKEQLEELFKKGKYEGIVFVSDGAEDDQVLPLVSSFAPIVSKHTVTVKQAKQLESLFYTVKTALEDPSFARFFLGIPGLLILLWALLPGDAPRLLAILLGSYLLLKGFGLEEPLINTLKGYLTFNPHSPSFPFHVISLVVLLVGSFLSLHTLTNLNIYEALRLEAFVLLASLLLFLLGKTVEAIAKREAYRIGDYILFGTITLTVFLVADTAINFLQGEITVVEGAFSLLLSLLIYFFLMSAAFLVKMAPLLSTKVIGASVYDRTGMKIGKIKKVKGGEIVIEKGKRTLKVPITRLKIVRDRVVLQ